VLISSPLPFHEELESAGFRSRVPELMHRAIIQIERSAVALFESVPRPHSRESHSAPASGRHLLDCLTWSIRFPPATVSRNSGIPGRFARIACPPSAHAGRHRARLAIAPKVVSTVKVSRRSDHEIQPHISNQAVYCRPLIQAV
jgi:hypothetical protein